MKYSKICIQFALTLSILTLTGGCRQVSWSAQKSPMPTVKTAVSAECIAEYFRKDEAPYITEQRQRFDPASGYLQIIAAEPTGNYTFTLMKDQFKESKQKTPFLSELPASFVNRPLTIALFYSFTGGAGLLDTSRFTVSENVKIEGRWYQPMTPPSFSGDVIIRLLKNVNTNRIELVELSQTRTVDSDKQPEAITDTAVSEEKWLLENYNFMYSKELDKLVPRAIDVFDIQKGLASKQLIIQFEYKNIVKN
jgi:hypothetical protein